MLEVIIVLVMALLVWAAVTDLRTRKILNWIPLSIFLLFWAFLAGQYFFGVDPPVVPVLPSIITGIATFAVFTGLFYFRFIGGGDVKLITAVSFWAGAEHIVKFIVIMALVGGVLAIFYMLRGSLDRDDDVDLGNKENKKLEKTLKKQVKDKKKASKSGNIPYGIAISAGGLFAVYPIFTILIA